MVDLVGLIRFRYKIEHMNSYWILINFVCLKFLDLVSQLHHIVQWPLQALWEPPQQFTAAHLARPQDAGTLPWRVQTIDFTARQYWNPCCVCEPRSSHCGECGDNYTLGWRTVLWARRLPTFGRNLLPPSSWHKSVSLLCVYFITCVITVYCKITILFILS